MRFDQKTLNTITLGVLTVSFLNLQAIAQETPNIEEAPAPILPIPETPPPIQPLPPLEEVLPPPQIESPGSRLTPEQIPGKIILKRFDVEGSTVFSKTELVTLLKPYTLRPISFAEILEVQKIITKLYIDNGYITSGAFIPPQIIEDRVLRIQVIEGSLESINITGLSRLNTGYVRSRLEIASKAPLNRDKLLKALQLLQLDPLIDNLSAELDPGVTMGKSILSIKIEEADAFNLHLALDNNRAPSVGTFRRSVGLSHGNLLGFGDRISIGYSNTDGSDSLNDLTYTIPLNPQNGTFSFSYLYSDSEIIEEPFDSLGIESNRNSYRATYRQPLYQTPTEDFAMGITFSRDESEAKFGEDIFGEAVPFRSRGSELDGQTKISALRFFQEYTTRNSNRVLALRSQFSVGIDAFDPTINNNNQPDSKFFAWRGQAQYLQLLSPETTILLRLDSQFAKDSLLPLEQFSLGGAFTVRGYRQDAVLADNGVFASAEVSTSLFTIDSLSTTVQLVPFVDVGHVWNTDDEADLEETLLSLGIGLRLLISDAVTARIDWGIPLINLEDTDETLQENGIHFSIKANLF